MWPGWARCILSMEMRSQNLTVAMKALTFVMFMMFCNDRHRAQGHGIHAVPQPARGGAVREFLCFSSKPGSVGERCDRCLIVAK